MQEQLGDTLWLNFLFLGHYNPQQGDEVQLQHLLNHMVRIHFLEHTDRDDYTNENLEIVAQFLQYIHHAFDYFMDFHYDTLVEAHNNLQNNKLELQEKLEITAQENGKLQEHIEQLLAELQQKQEQYTQQLDVSRSNIEKQQDQLQTKDEEQTQLQREIKDSKRKIREHEIENHRLKRIVDTLVADNAQLKKQKHTIQHYQETALQLQDAIAQKNAHIDNLYSDITQLKNAISEQHYLQAHINHSSRVQFVRSKSIQYQQENQGGNMEKQNNPYHKQNQENQKEVVYRVNSELQLLEEQNLEQMMIPSFPAAKRISQQIDLNDMGDQIDYELKRSQQNFSVAQSGTVQGKSRSKKYIEIGSSESINPKYRNIKSKNRELSIEPLVFAEKKQEQDTVRQTKTQRDVKTGKWFQITSTAINQLKSERISKDHPPQTPSRKNGSIEGKESIINRRTSEYNQTLSKKYQETGREAKLSKHITPNYNERLKYSPSNETLLKGPKRQRFMELLSQQRQIEQLQCENNSLKQKIILVEAECEALFQQMQADRQCLRSYETQLGRQHQQIAQYQSRIRQCEGQLLDYRQQFREQTTKYMLLKSKCREQFKMLTEKYELKVGQLEEFIEFNLSERESQTKMLIDPFQDGLHQANKAMQREKRMAAKNYQRSSSCVQVNKRMLQLISGTMIRENNNQQIIILTDEDYTDAFDADNADSSSIRIHASEGQDMLEKSEEKQEGEMSKLENSLHEYIEDQPHQFWNKLSDLISSKDEINQAKQKDQPQLQQAEQTNTAESIISQPMHLASKTVSQTVTPMKKVTLEQSVQTSTSSKRDYGINTFEQTKNVRIQTAATRKKNICVQVNMRAQKHQKRLKKLKIQPVINEFIAQTAIEFNKNEIVSQEKCDQIGVQVEEAKCDQNVQKITENQSMGQTMIEGLKCFPLNVPDTVFLQNSLDIAGKLQLIDTMDYEEWNGGKYFDEYVPNRMYIIEGESDGTIEHFVLYGSRVFQFRVDGVSQLFMEKHNAIRTYDDKFVNLGNGEVRIEEMELVITRTNRRNYFYGDIQDGKWSILKLHVYGLQLS